MKRFVTYLYLYDGRIKGNNAGFIKVEINGEKSAFLVQIKNLGKYSGKGKVYLVYEAEAVIEAGELTVKNGEAREIYNVDTENVKDSGKTFLQVLGVRIELENADEKFLASCWTVPVHHQRSVRSSDVSWNHSRYKQIYQIRKTLYRFLSLNQAARKKSIVKMLMTVRTKSGA